MTTDQQTEMIAGAIADGLEDLEGTVAHELDQLQRCVLALTSAVLRVEVELKTQRLERGAAAMAQDVRGGWLARILGR